MDFLKIAKGWKFALESTEFERFLKMFEIWVFLSKNRWYFWKIFWSFEKLPEPAKLPKNATVRARILKTFKVRNLGFLLNLDVSFKKTLHFFKNR